MTTPSYDAAVTTDSYSITGQRIELDGLRTLGIEEMTGFGFTIEGQTYTRGADGSILSCSDGIETPTDGTLKMTVGSYVALIAYLTAKALTMGITGRTAFRFVPFTVVRQWLAAPPSVDSYTQTMIVKFAGAAPEMPKEGANATITFNCKQQNIPDES